MSVIDLLYKALLRPMLFALPPESAHHLALRALRMGVAARPGKPPAGGSLERRALGLTFRNPFGLAAGFDKNGRYVREMEALGFGFVEVGSVTAEPWAGNPRPRLFRLPRDRALINRMGLNNDGVDTIAARLRRVRAEVSIPIFGNVALTPRGDLETSGALADYARTASGLAPVADAIVLNVSCPNTGDGRTFEDPELLDQLLVTVRNEIGPGEVPLLVKISSDLDEAVLDAVVATIGRHRCEGIVAVNTTIDRGAILHTRPGRLATIGAGGVSGAPLHARAIATVTRVRELTGDEVVVVGVGGITDAPSASAHFDAGADLVESYTGFVYGGPTFVSDLVEAPSAAGTRRTGKAKT